MFRGNSGIILAVSFTTFLDIFRRMGPLKITKMLIMIVLLKGTVNTLTFVIERDITDIGIVLHWGDTQF